MKFKASLHIHTAEDILEGHKIAYNIYQLIDRARGLGFQVLALTGHEHFIYQKEYGEYAAKNGILLIPGIELSLLTGRQKKNHVVVLNCRVDIESVLSFADLRAYRNRHPDIFIIAAHPNFHLHVSLGLKNLAENIELFDAVEHSWFYTHYFNLNEAAVAIAQKYQKPVIATSDLHRLSHLDEDYAVVSAAALETKDILRALKLGDFTNVTRAKTGRELARDILSLL